MKSKKNIFLVFLASFFVTGISSQRINKLIIPSAEEKTKLSKEILQPLSQERIRIIEQGTQNKLLQNKKEAAVPGAWVNVNALMTEGDYIPGSSNSKVRLFGNFIYPDSTAIIKYTNGTQSIQWMGMGQSLNFNNEAFSLANPNRRFVTSRDTVKVDSLAFNVSVYQDTSKGNIDTMIIYYGTIARTRARNGWYLGVFTRTPDAENNDSLLIPALATTGDTNYGYFPTVQNIPNLNLVKIPVDTGTGLVTIATPGLKLTNDSLLFYHIYFKPKEFSGVDDTVMDFTVSTDSKTAKSSFLSLGQLIQSPVNPSGNVRKRYFRDLNSKENNNLTWTFTSLDWAGSRYGRYNGDNGGVRNYLFSTCDRAPYTLVYFSGNSTLSTLEKQAPKFSIYPNPTKKQLNIYFKEHLGGNKTIELIDMVGRFINTYITRANQYKIDNLDLLTNGIYFVKISSENGTSTTRRLIIAH